MGYARQSGLLLAVSGLSIALGMIFVRLSTTATHSSLLRSAASTGTTRRLASARAIFQRFPLHRHHSMSLASLPDQRAGFPCRSSARRSVHMRSEHEGSVRVRFAPSPTGSLHVGGARTALYNWLLARQNKDEGRFVIRVEDTDVARSTKESERSVLGDLEWLGLKWDEGPFRQSERGDIYKEMVMKLVESGHAYPCFATDKELEDAKAKALAEGKNAKYDGKWRDADPEVVQKMKDDGIPYTYRFKVPRGKVVSIDDSVRGKVSWDAEATLGDFILMRSTGIPVYNFCVAVDDALMGISTVIRAEEHLTNTLRQMLILEALGYTPPEYAHLSLILGQDKQKLSKRHGATSVTQFKDEGFLPEAMINYLSLLGWNEGTDQEIYEVPELVEKFSLDRVIKSPAVFDMDKLRWINAQHIRDMDSKDLQQLIKPFFESPDSPLPTTPEFLQKATDISQQRMEVLADAPVIVREALGHPLSEALESENAKKLIDGDEKFEEFASTLISDFESGEMPKPSADGSYAKEFKTWAKALGKKTGRKGKGLFMPLRLLLTGRMQGPEVPDQISLAMAGAKDGVEIAVDLDKRVQNIRENFPVHSTA